MSLEELCSQDVVPKESAKATVDKLLEEGFLTKSNSAPDNYVVSSHKRQWRDLKLYFENQSAFAVGHKDLGIWIDQSHGLAEGRKSLSLKCFSLHVASAFSALARYTVTAAQLEEFMQFRYNLFKTATNHLNANDYAKSALKLKHDNDLARAKGAAIDPDDNTNPAFWSNFDLLQNFAENVGDSANTCMWAFLLLPLEFQQFNYLIINTRHHEDGSGCASVKRVQPTYHFISPKPKALTIHLMYEGGDAGHFTSLLIPNAKAEEFRKVALTASNSCFNVRFIKPEGGFWEPIADIYCDLSLADFTEKKLPKTVICLPSAPSVDSEVVQVPSQSQSPSDVENADGSRTEVPLNAEAPPNAVAELPPADPKPTKTDMTMDKVRSATNRIEDLCNRADGYSLQPFNPADDNFRTIFDDIMDISAQLKECSDSVTQRELQALDRQNAPAKAVANRFRLVCPRIAVVFDLRDKTRLLAEPPKKSKATSKAAKAAAAAASGCLPLDYMLRIKSNFAADDVSEDIQDGILLSLFRIPPTPSSLISFYLSVVTAAAEPSIRSEMDTIFRMPIEPSKQFATEIQRLTREGFDSVCDNAMVRGGKTFNQYLEYKNASSWNRIPNDHVLGETSLCCQVWKLNIALIWRRNGTWRIFVCTHGGNSPILCLLYASTRITLMSDGQAEFSPSPTCRFFPIFALSDDWFHNEMFIATIPNSIKDGEPDVIVEFNAAIHREFHLQSVVAVEGHASPDEISEVTADLSASQLMDSFIDSSDISQGDMPTPPEIRAIPIQTIASAVNAAMAIPLERITRRRRIIISSSESSQQAPQPAPTTEKK
jgi:hypothetical protein